MFRKLACILSGKHDPTLTRTDDGRLFVACVNCGWESKGVQILASKKAATNTVLLLACSLLLSACGDSSPTPPSPQPNRPAKPGHVAVVPACELRVGIDSSGPNLNITLLTPAEWMAVSAMFAGESTAFITTTTRERETSIGLLPSREYDFIVMTPTCRSSFSRTTGPNNGDFSTEQPTPPSCPSGIISPKTGACEVLP